MHRTLRAALAFLAPALLGTVTPLSAAHVYAAGPGGILVYDVAANGSLTLRQTVPASPSLFLAITPGGRFLYAADSGSVTEYATQADGTIRQQGAPLSPPNRAWHDIAMHPSGDYLFLADRITESVDEYSTDDVDGHLTFVTWFPVGAEAESTAVDPSGEFVFGGSEYQCPPGKVTTARVGPGGVLTVMGVWGPPAVVNRITADSRFLYVAGYPSACDPPDAVFAVMAIGADGSLTTAATYKEFATRILPAGGFLALAKGTSLFIYSFDRSGNRMQLDQKPIQVFALAGGKNCWANSLWVATDDGVVTYSLDPQTGVLTRIGKVMVNGVKALAFGIR